MSKWLTVLLLYLSACTYHMGFEDPCLASYQTISIPFICGDVDGGLTNAVIRELARSSSLQYRFCGGDLILQASIIEVRDENIGFSYDLTNKGKLTKSIIPTESRLKSGVEVSLIDAASGLTVLGPRVIRGSVDFDHEYESSRNAINSFSLGQLSDYDDAYDEAFAPLNRQLARKIIDFINEGW